MTPEELCVMVESTPLEAPHRMKLVAQNGIVLKPANPFLKCGNPVEWALSETDIDVNYITHFVKL